MKEEMPKNVEQEHMLLHKGAVVGSPPKSEEELEAFLRMWVPARPGKLLDAEERVMWLRDVAKISYLEALAGLYARDPKIYEQHAFNTWSNGYGETAKKFEIDLLKALQEAAE